MIYLTLLHSEGPKLYGVLAFLSAIGLNSLYILSQELLTTIKIPPYFDLCESKGLIYSVTQVVEINHACHTCAKSSLLLSYSPHIAFMVI